MAESNDRTYRVISIDPKSDPATRSLAGEGTIAEKQRYTDLGEHPGHDAEAACEVAADKAGLADGVKSLVAIPTGNWNECDVEEDPRPRYRAKRRAKS
jgi:hypothetical protein